MLNTSDTIVAIATPPGEGAIGVIRLSGPQAIHIVNSHFSGKDLAAQPTHTLHFGRIRSGQVIIDEVVASLYRTPKSYTGDDVVEVSCHGSGYVLQQLLQVFQAAGARMAKPGEFTLRAFLNGKLDLTQAEAVADLIASHSSIAHKAAMHNLRGGFSHDLKAMREELIKFSALIELELDFSQEDVEFADRTQLYALLQQLTTTTQQLLDSFRLGNVIRNGVSVAIVGKPNAGKSTLLNALLNEERAIVSDIAGTTRDTIEETLNINGVLFRLIDTAGIRDHSADVIEMQGIERSRAAMKTAEIVVYLFDVVENLAAEMEGRQADVRQRRNELRESGSKFLLVGNKIDEVEPQHAAEVFKDLGDDLHFISAKNKDNIGALRQALYNLVAGGSVQHEGTIVTNARHYAALQDVLDAVTDIKAGMDANLPGDLVSLDIRRALHYLGEITGEITTEDKLDFIFSKFCIGK